MKKPASTVGEGWVPIEDVGGAGPVRLGQVGESRVRAFFNIGPKVKNAVNGRRRIPDGMTGLVLTEVKNVKRLRYSRQLRDFADFAQQMGRRFDLFVQPNAGLSGPLLDAARQGHINLTLIP